MRAAEPGECLAVGAAPSAGQGPWLLALHSSGDSLGVALQPLGGSQPPRLAAFPLGRALANELLACVEAVLPASDWRQLGRLAVATGPGGFTGTRLTVTLARTLAQQLGLPLDGIGSFLLIARRLQRLGALPAAGALWLVQELPRRGLVAGLYAAPKPGQPIRELLAPRLYPDGAALVAAETTLASPGFCPSAASLPRCPAQVQQPEDVAELLRFSQEAAAAGLPAPWPSVVPLYPTSPVELRL